MILFFLIVLLVLTSFLIWECAADPQKFSGGGGGKIPPSILAVVEKYRDKLILHADELGAIHPYDIDYSASGHSGIHIGQRKLLLNEIEFMSLYQFDLVIYIGYAPSEKFTILAEMFPQVKFLLIDPNFPFFVTQSKQIRAKKFTKDPYRKYVIIAPDRIDQKQYSTLLAFKSSLKNALISLRNSRTPDGRKFDATTIRDPIDVFNLKTIGELMAGKARSYIIQDYATIELAERIAASLAHTSPLRVGLISDIRTRMLSESTAPEDADIIFNDQLQHSIACIINAKAVMFKTRLPWHTRDGVKAMEKILEIPIVQQVRAKFRELFPGKDNYDLYHADPTKPRPYRAFDGRLYFQPWGPGGTSESRLIAAPEQGIWRLKEYDSQVYEDQLFTHRLIRMHCRCKLIDKIAKYDQCGECTLEKAILIMYYAAQKKQILRGGNEVIKYYAQNRAPLNKFLGEQWRRLQGAFVKWVEHR